MSSFIAEHGINLLFTLITTGILAYCKYLNKKIQHYNYLNEQQNKEQINKLIQEQIQSYKNKIEQNEEKFKALKAYFKHVLILKCECYLNKGYMTPKEFADLSEIWKIYHDGLQGNSQGEDYYHQAIKLPIKDE